MTEMRKERRAPASLKVKYKSATVDDFIEQFGTDVSRGGIFIKTKKPLEAGALLKFEFQLQDGSSVLHGVGRVAWRRLEQPARPDLPAGMGIKFFKLSDHSRVVVERIESRYTGNRSRYELTDAAEFAPPMSGPPPASDSGANPLPGNGRRGVGSAPRTLPPPPALSSIPPALADVPPARQPSVPIRTSIRGVSAALPSGLPKAAVGSFFPETAPRKSGSPATSRSRDTSEFLASAFQAGGAGPEVRAQARAQAEHARRDPESQQLARELFGDLGESGGSAQARSQAASAASSAHPNNTPTHRPPASAPADAFNISTPVPAVELPRSPVPRASRPSLADRIPSIEQLVDEAGKPEPVSPSQRSALAASAGDAIGRVAPASLRPGRTPSSPGQQLAPSPAAGPEVEAHPPLSLAMSMPTLPPAAMEGESAGRSRLLLFVALASTIVLGGVAVYIGMQRNAAAERARQQAEVEKTPPAGVAPSEPPPAHADPQPSAAAAEPSPAEPAAPAPGPDVAIAINSKPRSAEVWFGGKAQGTTPLTTKLPSNVPVEISVRSPGFASVTRTVTPAEGAAAESFELAPLAYQLIVTSEPAGATVASSGKTAVSPAPLELGHLEGMINLSVEKDGYQRSSRSVRLDEFHEQDGVMRAEISLSLTPLPANPRRRVPRAAAPLAAPTSPAQTPPEPSAPIVQVKPEGEAPAPDPAPAPAPEAKAKPAEPPAAAPPPEPAPPAPAAPVAPAN
jgi:uncharacterized protein (TIGR02266 family)